MKHLVRPVIGIACGFFLSGAQRDNTHLHGWVDAGRFGTVRVYVGAATSFVIDGKITAWQRNRHDKPQTRDGIVFSEDWQHIRWDCRRGTRELLAAVWRNASGQNILAGEVPHGQRRIEPLSPETTARRVYDVACRIANKGQES